MDHTSFPKLISSPPALTHTLKILLDQSDVAQVLVTTDEVEAFRDTLLSAEA